MPVCEESVVTGLVRENPCYVRNTIDAASSRQSCCEGKSDRHRQIRLSLSRLPLLSWASFLPPPCPSFDVSYIPRVQLYAEEHSAVDSRKPGVVITTDSPSRAERRALEEVRVGQRTKGS